MGVLADTGKNIEHLTPVGFRVLHPVSRNNRQTKFRSQINERTIDAIFAAQKMPLNFDIHILAPETLDERLRSVFCTPDSARLSRVGESVSLSRTVKRLFR